MNYIYWLSGWLGTVSVRGGGDNWWLYVMGAGALLGYVYLNMSSGGRRRNPKTARSYWGSRQELISGQKRAKEQVARPKRNSVALYVGAEIDKIYGTCLTLYHSTKLKAFLRSEDDSYQRRLSLFRDVLSILKKAKSKSYRDKVSHHRLYIPDVQRGMAICGAPGSGKTFSVIDPSLRSAVDQGHPIILYDFKYPDQASLLVPYALLNGYSVEIFAPGFDESSVCNPLSFIAHVLDAETANQIATTMDKNFNLGDTKGDKFFDTSAAQLMQAAFVLARAFRESDLLTVQAFLSLADLVPRIKAWSRRTPEQDIAILFFCSKNVSFLVDLAEVPEIYGLFNFPIGESLEDVTEFNLLQNFLVFLASFFTDHARDVEVANLVNFYRDFLSNYERKNRYQQSGVEGDPVVLAYVRDIDSVEDDIKFLEQDLPSQVFINGRSLPSAQAVGMAIHHILASFQKMYENFRTYMGLLGLPRTVAETDKFLGKISFCIDAFTYFLNIHPDYNPARSQMRTRNLKSWIVQGFSQLISTEKSERTLASIVSVTNNNLIRFVKPNIARHFVGQTTLPLYLEGRKLIVFGLDRERRDTVGPLMATILHLIVNYNLTFRKDGERRKHPLVVALDELPTLYLPALTNWLNENRSDGFCGQIGFQNMNQLERSYGKEVARSILTGCNTKFIFNPGEPDSADFFSRMLGEEEIETKQRSRSTGKGGSSVSISEQEKGRKLFEPAQFLKLPQGKCVFLSPGYGNKTEKGIPFVKEIYVPPLEIELMERLKPLWEDFIKQRIVSLGGDQVQDDRLHLNRRQFFVDSLFSYIPSPSESD